MNGNQQQDECHKATVLIGQLEIIIFEEAVHEDDELAHAGGHGNEGVFTGCAGGVQGAIYHVMNRGDRRECIFALDCPRRFLEMLEAFSSFLRS